MGKEDKDKKKKKTVSSDKKKILENVRHYTREKQTARRKRMKEKGWAFYALELPPDLAIKVKDLARERRNKVIKTVVDLLHEAFERR